MTTINLPAPTKRSQVAFGLNHLGKDSSRVAPKILLSFRPDSEKHIELTLSQEAKKLLEDLKEAEKRKQIQEAAEKLKENARRLEQMKMEQPSKQEALAKKIAELKDALKQLLERMRSALLFGDKRAAALIAKEAARLAKDLAAAIREAKGADTAEAFSAPNIHFSDGSETSSEHPGNAEVAAMGESGENIDAQAETGAAEASALAGEALSEANRADAEDVDQPGQTGQPNQTDGLKALAEKALEKTKSANHKSDHDRDLQQIVAMLRAIASMAKDIMKRKATVAENPPEGSPQDESIQKEATKAIREIEEAIATFSSA